MTERDSKGGEFCRMKAHNTIMTGFQAPKEKRLVVKGYSNQQRDQLSKVTATGIEIKLVVKGYINQEEVIFKGYSDRY